MLDPAVALTYAAAHTERIKLGTGVIILPQRNPAVLAKELASVDVLSGGRLIFGIGIGYLEAEFDALGIPFDNKATRTVEYLQAIRSLWHEESPAYDGRFVRFAGVQARPRPQQQPAVPIVFGGMSTPALRRAVRYAHGWYGFNLDPTQTAECLGRLREVATTCTRPADLGELEISVTPPPSSDLPRDLVDGYVELGVDRLVPFYPAMSEDEVLAFVARVATDVISMP